MIRLPDPYWLRALREIDWLAAAFWFCTFAAILGLLLTAAIGFFALAGRASAY